MNDQLKDEVKAKVLQYLNFKKLETNKVEFKKQWHNLKEKKGLVEFLKDTTAIVNCYGGDDAFIIFGVGDVRSNCSNNDFAEPEVFDANLSDSGYSDPSDIKNLIDSNIDKPFRFDIDYISVKNKKLCVFHLPPSTDKPHVIIMFKDEKQTIHRNKVYVRSGSSKVEASKADLDRMYIERNSIIVERKADVAINFHGFRFSREFNEKESFSEHVLERPILIENRGTRVLPIYKIRLEFDLGDMKLVFVHETKSENAIIIAPNSIFRDNIKLMCRINSVDPTVSHKLNNLVNKVLKNPKHGDVICSLILATGEYLPSNLYMPNINHAKQASPNLAEMILNRTSLD